MRTYYDVIVVGGGHAGIEAALASARIGCLTALFTMDVEAIGRMSCNPAIGGTAKGHLVREIDALGGEMGKIADATGIHFRMLNKSRGPAVWSPRCQNDRDWYSREAKRRILDQSGLEVLAETVEDIITDEAGVCGVITGIQGKLSCKSLVICTGTFLRAVMFTGLNWTSGGRFGEPESRLSEAFGRLGLRTGRLKTGTPPRVEKRSIDFGLTERQDPDTNPAPFSFQNKRIENRQIPMFLTYTNDLTHSILRTGFDRSPMFTGRIKGVGPRYCPSVEDKVFRFSDKERHQIFLEPEGYESNVVYVNGFSTSLPEDIQDDAIHTIRGLENCKILRPGYAVEYDFVPPHQLNYGLEVKTLPGLFLAGQINGTSGYEEAAAQGLVAGINSAIRVKGGEPFILKRSESYIGVMVDDLINKGTDEPYRMFTSRAEYRLQLRQDNADSRLMRKGKDLGLVSNDQIANLQIKESAIKAARGWLERTFVVPVEVERMLIECGSRVPSESTSLANLLRRPEISMTSLRTVDRVERSEIVRKLFEDKNAVERTEIEVKYEGYLSRQELQIKTFEREETRIIPHNFDYGLLRSLSTEGREKLQVIRPKSIGQASRVSGVTAADVAVLLVAIRN